MPRRRHNSLQGTLGAQLTIGIGNTTITFAAALQENGANIASLAAGEYLLLKIENEYVWLTAYTAGATTGTVERAREGSTDATHVNGTPFKNVMTDLDFPIFTKTEIGSDYANHDLSADQAQIYNGSFPPRGKDAVITVEAFLAPEGNAWLTGWLYYGQPVTPGTRLYENDGGPIAGVTMVPIGEIMLDQYGSFTRRVPLSGLDVTKEVTWQALVYILGGSQSSSTLPGGSAPVALSVTPDGSKIYVPCFNSGDVSVIRAGGRPTAWQQDGHYMDFIESDITSGTAASPWPLAVATTNTHAVICNYNNTSITVITVATGAAVTYAMPSSRNPTCVCISPDGLTAYIGTQQGNVDRMTIVGGAFGSTLAVVASACESIGINPAASRLYSVHANANLYRITVSSFTTAATIAVGGAPQALEIVDDSKVWVVCRTTDLIRSVSQSTDLVVDSWALPFTTAGGQGVNQLAIVKGGVTGAPSVAQTAFLAFDAGRWCQFYIGGPFAGAAHDTHRGQLVTSTGALYSGVVGDVAVNDYGEIWYCLNDVNEVLKLPGARAVCRPSSPILGEFFQVTVET